MSRHKVPVPSQTRAITPRPDGTLVTPLIDRLPLGGHRIEAELVDAGRRLHVGVWGGGRLATLTLAGGAGPWLVRPNLVTSDPESGLEIGLSRTRPALLLRGSSVGWRAARLPLAGLDLGFVATSPERRRTSDGIEYAELPWGAVAIRRLGDGAVVGVGADLEEALSGARTEPETILREAEAYAQGCARLETDDAILGSLFAHSLHAALAAVKLDGAGGFAGLAAGPGYSLPPRTYYRDAYWTVPALLPLEPERVYQTIEVLAAGIHADGEAPSAVITPMRLPAALQRAINAHKGTEALGGEHEHDWWPDHFDSPLMFVSMIEQYVAFTGDRRPFEDHREKIEVILERYRRLCVPGSDLPLKPYNERDWADNVFRSGLVTYDLGLYHGALLAAARLAGDRAGTNRAGARGSGLTKSGSTKPGLTKSGPTVPELLATAERARAEARERLWLPGPGHFRDYLADDHSEDHLAIDTLTAVRGGLADEEQSAQILAAVARTLETRNNEKQPYGDFGVMCCYPPYSRRADLKAKSAFPYRYHNGADWPYWDGVYAGLLLERGAPGWRYPLTRWWEYSLQQGWLTPVEYFSPPYAPGARLQAWSSMPAASIMLHGFGVGRRGGPQMPPWGRSTLRGVILGSDRGTLVANNESLRLVRVPD